MLCKHCGAPTRVVSTRTAADGFVTERRRECSGAFPHRYYTYEIDDDLQLTLVKYATSEARVATLQKRVALARRNERIIERLRTGEKHETVALAYGLAPNMISTIARKHGLPTGYARKRLRVQATREARG